MPTPLDPFFCYYGGKWRSAPHYPTPKFDRIVEPFAGAAGYATRYPSHKVVLIDQNPIIVGLWQYLINSSTDAILALPLEIPTTVDDLDICEEAKWLIGFWCNKGSAGPGKRPSSWMRSGVRPNSYWSPTIRARIASQVEAIRHWQVILGDFTSAPDVSATWFVDPPYIGAAGKHYTCKFNDYTKLAEWCKSRPGQVIVCEQEGADWLPFEPFRTIKSTPGKKGKSYSKEAIWLGGC